MDEMYKAVNGYLYNAGDPDLTRRLRRAKDLCHDYNHLRPSNIDGRRELLASLLGRVGANVNLEPPFYCDYGENITLGDNVYANHGLVILDPAPVVIGDNCMFGPYCGIYTAGHPVDVETRISMLEFAYPIVIGDNVWLGGHVAVMPGVSIGAGTVVAAGSVVTKDLPPNVVAAGTPCRVLREIGPQDKTAFRRHPGDEASSQQ